MLRANKQSHGHFCFEVSRVSSNKEEKKPLADNCVSRQVTLLFVVPLSKVALFAFLGEEPRRT